MEQSFIAYIENSIKNNWDLDALTDYKGATLQYKDVARKIEKLHRSVYAGYFSPAHMARYVQLPLRPGEKINPAPAWVDFPGR